MTHRLDHEKANRKERARKQGTERASADFPVDPARTPGGRQLQKQLARAIDELLARFALLTDDVRTREVEAYRQRVTRIHDRERSRLTEADRLELAPILQAEWSRGLEVIRASLPRQPAVARERQARRRKAAPAQPSAHSRSRQNTKTARAKAEGNRSLRSLETLKVEVAIVDGRLFVGWSDNAEADRWLVVVSTRGRRLKQLTRPSELLAAMVDGVAVDYQPLRVRVYALRKKETLATGTAQVMH